jgi:hypothetical protein
MIDKGAALAEQQQSQVVSSILGEPVENKD